MLRIAESKIDSTPIAEGEIQVLRRDYFEGFDPNVGGDDTSAALRIVEKGFRAITAEDVVFYEPTPSNWKNRFTQKIRRGQHVLQAFLSHRRLLLSKNTVFSRIIFPMEFFLYILNPILFVPFIILFGLVLVSNIILTLFVGIIVVFSLIVNSTRNTLFTYLSNNLTMLAALFQELRGNKQLTWTKIEDTRIAPIK
jgi:cellulose synthase/poly-beta-1,6-N-acetylglucosamine synthase-like glycosyltransferase